jgi:hypothetical protein
MSNNFNYITVIESGPADRAAQTMKSRMVESICATIAQLGTGAYFGRFQCGLVQKESEMTNFPDRDTRPGYYDYMGSAPNSPMLIIGIVVGVLIVGGLIYSFSGATGVSPNQGATHQITQPAAPTTSPALPSPNPKP